MACDVAAAVRAFSSGLTISTPGCRLVLRFAMGARLLEVLLVPIAQANLVLPVPVAQASRRFWPQAFTALSSG
jgi:hypothetical protein